MSTTSDIEHDAAVATARSAARNFDIENGIGEGGGGLVTDDTLIGGGDEGGDAIGAGEGEKEGPDLGGGDTDQKRRKRKGRGKRKTTANANATATAKPHNSATSGDDRNKGQPDPSVLASINVRPNIPDIAPEEKVMALHMLLDEVYDENVDLKEKYEASEERAGTLDGKVKKLEVEKVESEVALGRKHEVVVGLQRAREDDGVKMRGLGREIEGVRREVLAEREGKEQWKTRAEGAEEKLRAWDEGKPAKIKKMGEIVEKVVNKKLGTGGSASTELVDELKRKLKL